MHGTYRYSALTLAFLAVMVFARPTRAESGQEQAREILDATGVKGGIVVHLQCGDGRLTAALRADDAYLVRGLDADKGRIAEARRHIRSRGIYGAVSAARWDRGYLPFTDNLINLIVAEEKVAIPTREIMRVLAPGGVAYLKADENWNKMEKPWPEDIGEWTHWLHGPGNNAVADDNRVGPPRQIQWKSGPEHARSHEQRPSTRVQVSAGGRIFGLVDEGIVGQRAGVPSEWKLVARDAFNGKLLWKRAASRSGPRTLVAAGDKLLTTLGDGSRLTILDAATGETLHICDGTKNTKEILVSGETVLGLLGGGEVVAADRESGRILWRKKVGKIDGNSMAAENGRLCFTAGGNLVCRGLDNGTELWRAKGRGKYIIMLDDVVLLAGNHTEAFSARSGERLWKGPPRSRRTPGIFVVDGLIWSAWPPGTPFRGRTFGWEPQKTVRKGYDPATGAVKKTVSVDRLVTPGHHIRCYPPKATKRYLLLNQRGVEFLDLQGDDHMRHNWLRPDCHIGAMPANGLLYLPPHPCFCYPGVLLNGLNAFTSRTTPERKADAPAERLVRGAAWNDNRMKAGNGAEREWPTYRHDALRSGSVEWTGPSAPEPIWETKIEGKLSPPVAADGTLFVADIDSHTVHCLDANSGESLWSCVADARVDSPPTIYKGLALFGSADGNVYCLRAADGALVWRFRAAPAYRRISIRGQVESAWPSHGSVLVRDGRAYVTAGRNSHLEGGIHIYALDPETGEIIHERQLENERPDVSRDAGRPFDMEGARSDILVAGAEDIYMFQMRFNADLSREPMPRVTKMGDRLGERHLICTGGFLDQRWAKGAFNRLFWTYSARWPGYNFAYKAPKSGQILVFNEDTTYAVKYYYSRHGHSPEFRPGSGYKLYADRNTNEPVLLPSRFGQDKGGGFSREQFWKWTRDVPVRVEAMMLAGDYLYLAGTPDLGPGKDARDAMRGLKGAHFQVVAAEDGETVSSFKTEQAPVFDGMIAAYGRIFMVCRDGTVMCLGTNK